MSALQLPPARLALRHPSVRASLLLLAVGPPWVAWLGKDVEAPIRLRLLGLAVAVVAAYSWDDRVHALTASTPVGLPAVRRGRALVVALLLSGTFGLGVLAVPADVDLPATALLLQTGALAALLLALVGWFGRDGDPVLALPAPALLVSLVVLNRLPEEVALLRADPGSPAWPDERTRWWVLLAMCVLLVVGLSRDPAARRLRWPVQHRDEGRDRPRSALRAGAHSDP